MAQAGSRNFFQWKTLKGNPVANCTVRISYGGDLEQDSNFKPLHPKDGSANSLGWFPCGRQAGFEGKEFKLPNSVTCLNCIVQFV